MQLPQAPQAQAVGGPMMMGPGGQNTFGARAAEQSLAQQGFMMQPQLAALTPGARPPVVPSSGSRRRCPARPAACPRCRGRRSTRPSQLQMALMSGSISPYDMYARQAAFGSGYGST